MLVKHTRTTLQLLYRGLMFNVGSLRVPMTRDAGVHFAGLPLTALASSVMDEFSDEARSIGLLGLFATIPVGLEYWTQFKEAEQQMQEEADKARKETARNMLDLVCFHLLMPLSSYNCTTSAAAH